MEVMIDDDVATEQSGRQPRFNTPHVELRWSKERQVVRSEATRVVLEPGCLLCSAGDEKHLQCLLAAVRSNGDQRSLVLSECSAMLPIDLVLHQGSGKE